MKKTILSLVMLTIAAVSHAQSGDVLLGFYAGMGSAFSTASLHDNFDGCITFNAGLTGGYQRWRLKADVAFGQPSFNRQNMFAVYDSEGHDAQLNAAASASFIGVSAQAGYTVLQRNRLAITPSAGIFWSRYGWDVNDIEWSKNPDGLDVFQVNNKFSTSLSHVGWAASIDFDIKLHERYTSMPFSDEQQARYTSYLRITPWVAQASYNKCTPHVKGCFVGINLTYAGLLQSLTDLR